MLKKKLILTIIVTVIKFTAVSAQNYEQLQKQLEAIGSEDQKYRLQIDSIEKQFGSQSPQLKKLWETIHHRDSINKISVIQIIDKYGWIGSKEIGYSANTALFYVIMHSDFKTQEKYLPVIRAGVKKGKAYAGNLAMLEDRIALSQGKKQIYGTQLRYDEKTKEYYLVPLEDPENVDKRRKKLNLCPLAEDYNLKVHKVIWKTKK